MGAMSRRKGATAERAVVAHLRSLGVPADRTSRGADVHGMGDIDGIPGLVIEVKATKSPAPARRGVILWKPPGVAMSAVGLWLAVSPMGHPTSQRVPATRWLSEAARGPFVTRVGGSRFVYVREVDRWAYQAHRAGLIDIDPAQRPS